MVRLVVAVLAACMATGVLVLVRLLPRRSPTLRRSCLHESSGLAKGRIIWILAPALLVGLVTRWPVGAILAAAAGAFLPRLFGATTGHRAAEKVEATAAWSEMLRDAMSASSGLGQAIVTTASLAPVVIRDSVMTLAGRVEAAMPLGNALRQFARDVDEPAADLVVAALVLASERRAQKIGDLLGALATAAREEVAMRLRVESSRSQVRTGIRVVSGFSIGFALFLVIVAHRYLAPFGSATGQLMLLAVGAFYAGGLALMMRMARPRGAGRLDLAEAVLT